MMEPIAAKKSRRFCATRSARTLQRVHMHLIYIEASK